MSRESVSRDQHLQEILAAYLQEVEAGKSPDRDKLLAEHADLADDLRSFLAENDRMRRLVNQHEAATMAPDLSAAAAANSSKGSTKVRYFGDYELLEEIARGGMGVVYKARQVSLNRTVALKMILAGELASPADVQRFHSEAEAAANLDHPNIVPIYEVGQHEGQHFFSMKLVEGGSLSGNVAGGQWPVASKKAQQPIARLMATVARAVHHAHQRGILHRDLKPANLLLDSQGEPHVTDFGLARRLLPSVEGGGPTKSGDIVGTPSYMPPEQARGDKVLSTAVDVYSLGAILFELLTGRPPFRGDTPMQTLLLILEQEAPSPAGVNPEAKIDRDLQTICLKCLEKEPAQRYRSAEALAEDLERWRRGEPIAARPVRAPERLWRWCRRKPALTATIVLTVLALGAAIAVAVVAGIRERALIARQELEEREKDRVAGIREHALIARQEREEREKDRERLRTSLIEQARAQRTAGDRERSLDALRKAADIRRDDELRFEAIATVARPGLRPLGVVNADGVDSWVYFRSAPRVNADGTLVALNMRQGEESRIDVFEIPSGKLVRKKIARSGLYKVVDFRPGTTQLALLWVDTAAEEVGGGRSASNLQVSLWDYGTDQDIGNFGEPGVEQAVFNPDGSRLLTIKGDILNVWNVTAGGPVLAGTRKMSHNGEFRGFLSRDELLLLPVYSPREQDRYKSWNVATGQERWLTPAGLSLKPVGSSATARLAVMFGRLAPALFPAALFPGKNAGPNPPIILPDENPRYGLHIWDLAIGQRVGVIPDQKQPPSSVFFSPNGRYLVFDDPADLDKSIRVWDLCLHRFTNRLTSPRGFTLSEDNMRSFNPDGTLLASVVVSETGAGEKQPTLCVWDTATGAVLATLPGSLFGYVWSSDGRRLISQGGAVSCWEVARPLPSYDLGKAIKSLSLNKDGDRLAVNQFVCSVIDGDQGPQLAAWTGYEGWRLNDHEADVVAGLGKFRNLMPANSLFPLHKVELVPQFVGKDEIWALELIDRSESPSRSRDAPRAFSMTFRPSSRSRLEDPFGGASLIGFTGAASVQSAGPLPATAVLCPKTVEFFPRNTFQTYAQQLTAPRRKVALASAGYAEHEAWAREDSRQQTQGHVTLNSVVTKQWAFAPEAPLLIRSGEVRFNQLFQPWDKDDSLDASWSHPCGILELWNYREGKRLAILGRQGGDGPFQLGTGRFEPGGRQALDGAAAECFQFSPDGRRFAVSQAEHGPAAGALQIWDTASVKVEKVLGATEKATRPDGTKITLKFAAKKLTFSPDSRRLLAVNAGVGASLFDVDTGREVQSWKIKKGDWQAIALNPEGTLAAAGGEDKMLHLWDVASGKELARWQGHDGGVTALLFSRDGHTLYSGSQDGVLKLWHLPLIRKELRALDLDW